MPRDDYREDLTSAKGFLTQEVTFSADSCDGEERGLVRSLQSGDSIVVKGHAGYRGWTNFVKEVRITISETVIARW